MDTLPTATIASALSPTERKRIAPLREAARLRGCHPDTLINNERDKLIEISPKRLGMRVEDALRLED